MASASPPPHVSLADALARLPGPAGTRFRSVFRHGTLDVEIYAPRGRDLQTPHTRDEVYIVMRGTGQFVNGDRRHPFGPGDFLFVPAGVVHRFEDFTDDLAVWVLFYGPEGGERPSATDAAHSQIEIERKFLSPRIPEALSPFASHTIRQGYLTGASDEGPEVRLRQVDDAFFQTIKHEHAEGRTETEIALGRAQFEALWPATAGRRLAKQRHRIRYDDVILEIDHYRYALEGLVIAEVEFTSPDARVAFDPPAWLGTEVTGDRRYRNRRLAIAGLPAQHEASH